jgi:hypothetical protein
LHRGSTDAARSGKFYRFWRISGANPTETAVSATTPGRLIFTLPELEVPPASVHGTTPDPRLPKWPLSLPSTNRFYSWPARQGAGRTGTPSSKQRVVVARQAGDAPEYTAGVPTSPHAGNRPCSPVTPVRPPRAQNQTFSQWWRCLAGGPRCPRPLAGPSP